MIRGRCGPIVRNVLTITDGVVFSGGAVTQNMETDATGRTSVSATISTKTLVLASFGQSMAINQGPTPYTPANSTAHALNPYDLTVYRAKDPEIGTWTISGGHNYLTRLADKLITDGKFARVILLPLNIGSSSVFDWIPSGVLNQRVRFAALNIRNFGWDTNANAHLGVLWDQGHAEAGHTSKAVYKAAFNQVRATMVGLGLDIPWFIEFTSYASGVVDSVLETAEAETIDNVKIFSAGQTDTITDRAVDGVHYDDTGTIAAANVRAAAIEAYYP